jgi:ribonucleoside-diphosphate reductase alpha chain/ribonucleoside-triphosphate reductase
MEHLSETTDGATVSYSEFLDQSKEIIDLETKRANIGLNSVSRVEKYRITSTAVGNNGERLIDNVYNTKEEAQKLFDNMFNLRQFLSGRTMWTGGTEVAKKYPMSNFNCSFTTISKVEDFSELFYLLMLGCGVGVRMLKEDVAKIPKMRTSYELIHQEYSPVAKYSREDLTSVRFRKQVAMITVGDSKTGWVDALKNYFNIITHHDYHHIDTIIFIYDNVRPNGEKLKTFGGTASGHEALKDLFTKIDRTLRKIPSMSPFVRLRPIDALDICNIIGEGVVG